MNLTIYKQSRTRYSKGDTFKFTNGDVGEVRAGMWLYGNNGVGTYFSVFGTYWLTDRKIAEATAAQEKVMFSFVDTYRQG
jgi:hypothetical protein